MLLIMTKIYTEQFANLINNKEKEEGLMYCY